MLLRGNCLETLATLPDNSVDSIVTDPPYELGFMGKSWDNSGIAYNQDLWAQCLRVLKPGGHLLAFSGSRTYHRMTVAIEDAGFEIRDQIMWLYGSGFPKSLDVSKAIDKAAGAKRARVPTNEGIASGAGNYGGGGKQLRNGTKQVDEAITPEAQRWQGWGTALKPAHEPIVVARKPLIGTVANNVLTYGTGALNIDGSRVGTGTGEVRTYEVVDMRGGNYGQDKEAYADRPKLERTTIDQGRWPANVIHDGSEEEWSRFFYCAKASKSERNAGLEGLPERETEKMDGGPFVSPTGRDSTKIKMSNFHPTVKPLALMRYLIKLVTPPGGTVLDPFLGSGSTAVAATLEGFDWIGCEMTEDYFPIIEARVAWAVNQPKALPL